MNYLDSIKNDKRIRIITGHYGSGKSEFSVNYALALRSLGDSVSLVDLDIVNPYFRSRERAKDMEERGITVISGAFGHDSNLDIPMVSASALGPIRNESENLIMDLGGDDVGARVLGLYGDYLNKDNTELLFVLNSYRRETSDLMGALSYMRKIEDTIGIKVTGIVCNTHLLRDTSKEDIEHGIKLANKLSEKTGVPVKYIVGLDSIGLEPETLGGKYQRSAYFPINMHLRKDWM